MAAKDFPHPDEAAEKQLVFDLTQYGLSRGLIMYPEPPYENYGPTLAPVTLYPTPFPKESFEKAKALAQTYNELYCAIVHKKKWLLETVKELAPFDADFTGKLYESYLAAVDNGIHQPVSLALVRNDYMYDEVSKEIKEVEFNTVSVSFGGLSNKVGDVHSFANRNGLYTGDGTPYYDDESLPVSESAHGLADGLRAAVDYYESTAASEGTETIVLFVTQPNERNAFDQRALEYELFHAFGIPSKRVDLPDVTSLVKVDHKTHKLYYEGREVSVVYYRSAYAPYEFKDPAAWDCRVLLESTLAVKCPSLAVQLSGAKKIQQMLTEPAVLDKFLPVDSPAKESIQSTFCKIYPLDDSSEAAAAKKLAFEHPEQFVLKPQREGGGNNVYKEDIPEFLEALPEEEWAGYILMEMIHPKTQSNVILRNGKLLRSGVVSELGMFGTYLFNEDSGKILHNEYAGYLLRSKISSSNEGGVAAGYGCVDSLYLY